MDVIYLSFWLFFNTVTFNNNQNIAKSAVYWWIKPGETVLLAWHSLISTPPWFFVFIMYSIRIFYIWLNVFVNHCAGREWKKLERIMMQRLRNKEYTPKVNAPNARMILHLLKIHWWDNTNRIRMFGAVWMRKKIT